MTGGLVDDLVAAALNVHGWPVYGVVAGLAFLETAAFVGMVLPGDSMLLLAGLLAERGNVSLGVLLPLAAAAAIAGDTVGYGTGRRFGAGLRRTRAGRWVRPTVWESAERLVARRGATAVVGARWVGVLRALVPTLAGMTGMPFRRFLAANVVGGTAWASIALLLGYTAGASLARAQLILGTASTTVLALFVIVAGVAAVRMLRHRRRTRPLPTPGTDAAP